MDKIFILFLTAVLLLGAMASFTGQAVREAAIQEIIQNGLN